MNLIQELTSIKHRGLKVDNIKGNQSNNYYSIKTKENKIITIGKEVDDSFHHESEDYLYEEIVINLPKVFYNYLYPTNRLYVFYISNNYITYIKAGSELPCAKISKSLPPFFEAIKNEFPELKTKSELEKEELKKLRENNQWLLNRLKDYEHEEEKAKMTITELQKNISSLEYNENELKNKMKTEINKNKYLSSIVKEVAIQKLTQKQKEFIVRVKNDTSIININLFYPNLLIEFDTIKSVAFDDASDWQSLPTVEYIIVDKDGNAENITKSEISKSPKFAGFYDFREKLIGCVSINKDDLR